MRGRTLAAGLLMATLASAAVRAAAGWGFSAPAAPRFAVVPSAHVREGQGQLDALQAGASAEGFLDRLLGTNCFTQAVSELHADCRRMDQEAKTRLALRMTNCQLAMQGSSTAPCHARQSLKECTEALPDRGYTLFVEFLTHADTMCLFIQNQNFERYTENMLNRLAEGAGYAREQLAEAAKSSKALSRDAAELKTKAESALIMLRQHGEMEEESLKLQKKVRAEALAYFMSLDSKQQHGLELQDQALQRQAALEAGQATVLSQLADAQSHVAGLFDLVDDRAAELAAAAARQAEAQRALAGELGALADSSAGIRSAVDVVIGYQQRSDTVLMRLLGKSYSLEDAAFYAVGALAAMAAGVSRATAKAKLPVLALLGMSLLLERLLVDWLHAWMDVAADGELVLTLPLLRWVPWGAAPAAVRAAVWQLSVKWGLRRVVAALAGAALLYSWLSYRDYEHEAYRLLRQLEDNSKRRHEEYLALINRQKVELAAMLGGAAAGPPGALDVPVDAAAGRGKRGGAEGAAAAATVKGRAAAQVTRAVRAGGGQIVPVGRQRNRILSVTEEWSEEEAAGEEDGHSLRAAAMHGKQQRELDAAAAAAPTPAARERKAAAPNPAKVARPSSAPLRPAATGAGGRKRGASEEAEGPLASAPLPAKRQATGGRRRTSTTEEVVAASVELGGPAQQQRKRTRRGYDANTPAGPPPVVQKRARRS